MQMRRTKRLGVAAQPNMSAALRYARALSEFSEKIGREARQEIMKLVSTKSIKDELARREKLALDEKPATPEAKLKILIQRLKDTFLKFADTQIEKVIPKMISEQLRASHFSVTKSIEKMTGGLTIKSTRQEQGLEDVIRLAAKENVALIKSLPVEMLDKMEKIVADAFLSGSGTPEIHRFLLENLTGEEASVKRRAYLIANDQSRKIFQAINVKKFKDLGVKKFVWRHVPGSMYPRIMHQELNGKTFSFDDPPIIDKKGTRGFPAQLPNCRCIMTPVWEFDLPNE